MEETDTQHALNISGAAETVYTARFRGWIDDLGE